MGRGTSERAELPIRAADVPDDPPGRFRITLTRIAYRRAEVIVTARSAEEARDLALGAAGSLDWPGEHHAEYEVEHTSEA